MMFRRSLTNFCFRHYNSRVSAYMEGVTCTNNNIHASCERMRVTWSISTGRVLARAAFHGYLARRVREKNLLLGFWPDSGFRAEFGTCQVFPRSTPIRKGPENTAGRCRRRPRRSQGRSIVCSIASLYSHFRFSFWTHRTK